MNGPRMNQFVAPTSFITSISRRRAKIERRIVFAIRSVEATTSRMTAIRKTSEMTFAIVSTRFAVALPHFTASTPDQPAVCTSLPSGGVSEAFSGTTVYESGSGFSSSLTL